MSLITNKLRMATPLPLYGKPPHWIMESPQVGSIAIDSEDNIIMVGSTNTAGAGGFDIELAKFDIDGNPIWGKTFGSASGESGGSICIDSSDNIIITYSMTDGTKIAKVNSSGTLQWNKSLTSSPADGGNFYGAITTDDSDNIIAAGGTVTGSSGTQDGLIVKYSPSGVLQWKKRVGGTSQDSLSSVVCDSSGNIYVGGTSSSTGTGFRFVIAKFDSSGAYLGGRRTQYGTNCYGLAINRDTNELYATGLENFGTQNIYFLRYSLGLTLLTRKRFGTSAAEYGNSIAIDRAGNIIIAGTNTSTNAVYLTKRDYLGNEIWSRTSGSNSSNMSPGVVLDSTDNIIINFAPGAIAKMHPDGIYTGTYTAGSNTYTYSSVTQTVNDGGQGTEASITTFTSGNSTMTENTLTLTSGSITPTNTIISVP